MQTPALRAMCCGCNEQIPTDYRSPMEKKGWHGHSLSERAETLAWTGFYCFSEHIYYAQVRFRWLHFSENKGEDVANYIKEEGYLQM